MGLFYNAPEPTRGEELTVAELVDYNGGRLVGLLAIMSPWRDGGELRVEIPGLLTDRRTDWYSSLTKPTKEAAPSNRVWSEYRRIVFPDTTEDICPTVHDPNRPVGRK